MKRSQAAFYALLVSSAAVFFYLIYYIVMVTPQAQMAAGGLAQKIFYFHVPAAYAMYLSGVVCFVASAALPGERHARGTPGRRPAPRSRWCSADGADQRPAVGGARRGACTGPGIRA